MTHVMYVEENVVTEIFVHGTGVKRRQIKKRKKKGKINTIEAKFQY